MHSRLKWVLAAMALTAAGTCVATGISLVPPAVALGPCLKDWTSTVSYRHRVSPLATMNLRVGSASLRLCYGRPSVRGRHIWGELVPYDSVWRLGANEPTRLSVDGPIALAGIPLPAGRYSLYAIPHPDHWELFVSRSTLHWGNAISPAVRRQEVGRATVAVEHLATPIETLTVWSAAAGTAGTLRVEWDSVGVTLPVVQAH